MDHHITTEQILALIAILGVIWPILGAVLGAKVSVRFLEKAHTTHEKAVGEEFKSVWSEIKDERKEREGIDRRLVRVETVCKIRQEEGGCE